MNSTLARLCLILVLLMAPVSLTAQHQHGPADEASTSTDSADSPGQPPRLIARDGQRILEIPQQDWGIDVLEPRRAEQIKRSRNYAMFHDFSFTEQRAASGITFKHDIVDDAGKTYKPVHYDHGNGVAAADVDGDGHLDLYFLDQLGTNELWRNRGDGTFEDITERAGVAVADRVSVAATFADLDNDGDADLAVTTVRMGNLLFENLGEGRFRDITKTAGFEHVGHSSGIVAFDYDRDGLLDLFVTNVGSYTIDDKGRGGAWVGRHDAFAGQLHPERFEASLLYRNQGKLRFREVSAAVGLIDNSWSGDATVTDLDGDGWLDLYVANMQGDDHAYRNAEGKRFIDVSDEYFPRSPWGTMGVHFFDWNQDGDADLVLTDMHSDMSEDIPPTRERLKSRMQWPDKFLQGGANNIWGNAFWDRREKGEFTEVSDEINTENYWPWGVSVGDLNADGFEDMLFTSSMNYPFTYGLNSVLLNEHGQRFQHAEFLLGVEPRAVLRGPWFDLDCSGVDAEHDHCQGLDGKISVWANLGSRSAVLLDLEHDGDLDIVTNDFNSAPLVLISNLSEKIDHRWLQIALEGTQSNRDGLGAKVTIVTDLATMTRFVDGKSGYLSQSSMPLFVGLGKAKKVESISVSWPSGIHQVVTEGLAMDRRLTIREPKSVEAKHEPTSERAAE